MPPVPMLDRFRRIKRRADERYGNLSRLLQFCGVGASGMVVDLSTYSALQAVLGTLAGARRVVFAGGGALGSITRAEALAAFLGIAVAMTWNFTINRRLTFNDARRGSIPRQYLRYALSNLLGCTVSFAFRLGLPGSVPFFARHRLVAAVAGIVAATGISFTMARWFVFGVRPGRSRSDDGPPGAARRDARRATFPARHPARTGSMSTVERDEKCSKVSRK